MRKAMILQTILLVCGISLIGYAVRLHSSRSLPKVDFSSDTYIRNQVYLLLKREVGSCSSIKVISASGKRYVLSAAHCANLADKGIIAGTTEQGTVVGLQILEVDVKSDLMLLSSPDQTGGIPIAADVQIHEKIKTLTHGAGHVTYRTDGEVLETLPVTVNTGRVEVVTMTSALVVPGSSGGAATDLSGALVGVVSLCDGVFGGLIPLSEINTLMAGR